MSYLRRVYILHIVKEEGSMIDTTDKLLLIVYEQQLSVLKWPNNVEMIYLQDDKNMTSPGWAVGIKQRRENWMN